MAGEVGTARIVSSSDTKIVGQAEGVFLQELRAFAWTDLTGIIRRRTRGSHDLRKRVCGYATEFSPCPLADCPANQIGYVAI